MKSKKTIVNSRRKSIYDYLKKNKEASTNELVLKFNVSDITIRRDLKYLESEGLIERYYGGGRINASKNPINAILEEKKNKIAKKCAEYINDNDDIFINSSSTALYILKYLKNKRINVITNNAKALFLDIDPNINLILTGGKISHPKHALTGTFALNNLKTMASNISVIGISGITKEGDLTTSVLDEVEINKYMIEESVDKNILVCDSSKFSKASNFKTGSLSSIDILITDDEAKRDDIEMAEKMGVKVIIV